MLVTYMIANQNDFTKRHKCDICGCDVNCLHSLSFSRKSTHLSGKDININYGIHAKGHKICLAQQIPILIERKTEYRKNITKIEGYELDISGLEQSWVSEQLGQPQQLVQKWLDEGWIPLQHHQLLINALNL